MIWKLTLSSVKRKHSAKCQKKILAECRKKHSANYLALGKDSFSGSDTSLAHIYSKLILRYTCGSSYNME
jgi:hypothetical protein